jgi:hypothetical protein
MRLQMQTVLPQVWLVSEQEGIKGGERVVNAIQ